MCVHVCMHVGVCVNVYVCVCISVCTCMWCVCVCMCVHMCMHVCVCMENFPMLQCKWCPWYLYIAPISSRDSLGSGRCPIGTCTVVPILNIIFICAAQWSTTIGHCTCRHVPSSKKQTLLMYM